MTDHTPDQLRTVTLERLGHARFRSTAPSGATIEFGDGEGLLTPVQLLLTAIAGCSALDVEAITSKKEEPASFTLRSEGYKVGDDGNHLVDIAVTFDVRFSDSEAGVEAAGRVERAMQQSHDRLCTVTRTVLLGADVTFATGDVPA